MSVVSCWLIVLLVLLKGAWSSDHRKRRSPVDRLVSLRLTTAPGSPTLTGRIIHTDRSSEVVAFAGIPYAEPPLGALRFSLPVKKTFHPDEKIEARYPGDSCLQLIYAPFPFFVAPQNKVSEDCLYLNVFTKEPWLKSSPPSTRPVIFYLHGGSFSNGDGISRDGSGLTDYGDVVLVTVNYRLGLLGFPDLPGVTPNLGLWDAVMALQWVQDNIGEFGGDKDRVTIMGESAGGALVTYLHTSPLTGALFAQSIPLSGSQTAPWAYNSRQSWEEVHKWPTLVEKAGCGDEKSAVCCLRNLSTYELWDVMWEMSQIYQMDTWAPMVDGVLVTSKPVQAIQDGHFTERPVLSGICADEGVHIAMHMAGSSNVSIELNNATMTKEQFWDLSVGDPMNQNGTFPCMSDGGEALVELYRPADDGVKMKEQYAKFMGDWLLTCPQFTTADELAAVGYTVYQYTFDYKWTRAIDKDKDWQGTLHNFDLAFIFGLPFSSRSPFTEVYPDVFGRRDRAMSKAMIGIVSSFAATGKPIAQIDGKEICWGDITSSEEILVVGTNELRAESLTGRLDSCYTLLETAESKTVEC